MKSLLQFDHDRYKFYSDKVYGLDYCPDVTSLPGGSGMSELIVLLILYQLIGSGTL